MDFSTIVQVISSQGFPIAFCILIYFDLGKKIDKLEEVINNNTIAMNKIIELTRGDKNE